MTEARETNHLVEQIFILGCLNLYLFPIASQGSWLIIWLYILSLSY